MIPFPNTQDKENQNENKAIVALVNYMLLVTIYSLGQAEH